jgi:hypothetical protein
MAAKLRSCAPRCTLVLNVMADWDSLCTGPCQAGALLHREEQAGRRAAVAVVAWSNVPVQSPTQQFKSGALQGPPQQPEHLPARDGAEVPTQAGPALTALALARDGGQPRARPAAQAVSDSRGRAGAALRAHADRNYRPGGRPRVVKADPVWCAPGATAMSGPCVQRLDARAPAFGTPRQHMRRGHRAGGATALEGTQRTDGGPPASPGPPSGTGAAQRGAGRKLFRTSSACMPCSPVRGARARRRPHARARPERAAAAARAGIRLAGATSDVHIMDVRSGKWERMAPQGEPPSPRAAHAAAAVGSMVVVQARAPLAARLPAARAAGAELRAPRAGRHRAGGAGLGGPARAGLHRL